MTSIHGSEGKLLKKDLLHLQLKVSSWWNSDVQWLLKNWNNIRQIQVQHWKTMWHMNGTICRILYSPHTQYEVSAQIKRPRNTSNSPSQPQKHNRCCPVRLATITALQCQSLHKACSSSYTNTSPAISRLHLSNSTWAAEKSSQNQCPGTAWSKKEIWWER